MRRPISIMADAVPELYSVPRGIAADLTASISLLADNPTPENSQPAPGRPGRHELRAHGYIVTYSIGDEKITIWAITED